MAEFYWYYFADGHRECVRGYSKLELKHMEQKHGRWERCGGDLHSSGYAIYCSACHKVHFVHYKHSLGGLNCEELFEKPKHCPSCGAVMEIGE